MIRILFVGDVVGQPGRDIVLKLLSKIKKDYNIDFTILNGENSAHGKGITTKIYHQFIDSGVDCITLGNHAFSKAEIKNSINDLDFLIRPLNLDIEKDLGKGYRVFNVKGYNIAVINLMCKIFMYNVETSPFEAMSKLLYQDKILSKDDIDFVFVDLHGEATSEKILFAQYFKHTVNAVVGTHTHVQTADERLIDNLAFISDVGMCGCYDSIIGRDIEETIETVVYGNKNHYQIALGEAMFCGVVIEIDEIKKKTIAIKRIQIRPY